MNKNDLQLLKKLCSIQAPSGSEASVKEFLLDYVNKNSSSWKVQPELVHGEDFQDCLLLVFGQPTTAIYAHMDSVGYSVGYDNELLKIGGPKAEEGTVLIGEDSKGKIEAKLHYKIEDETEDEKVINTILDIDRKVDRGTTLTYQQNFKTSTDFVESCYLDDRLGIWTALKVAETLENGVIAFSCWEEVGGGSVGYLAKYLFEQHQIRQALIADITWVTNGVKHGKGVAVSMRDSGIPRRSYIDKIISLAKESGIDFQLEVESAGGSDGNALQKSPYPVDWCFIGAPEDKVHMPSEKVHFHDIECMHKLYSYLMQRL
ncbi:MAG: M20/M25/M40 family metallo-hydrolase [Vicingaceae bacterium]